MGSIQSAKIACGYQSANQRPTCSRCAHVEERGASYAPTWYCNSAGFLVSTNAICNRYAPRDGAGPVTPPMPASRP